MLGAGLPALDLSSLLHFVLLALFLVSGLLLTVRRAASRYFVVDASFESGYEDQRPAMSIGSDEDRPSPAAAETCATCGNSGSKKCSGCKRVRYCSQACQSKHWNADHKFKCKQMRLSDNAVVTSCVNGASRKTSSSFRPISLVPACKQSSEVLFPYDDFLKLFNGENPGFTPCGLLNCGNSCFANVVLQCLACTRPLVEYLLRKDHDKGCVKRHEDWCFLCELQSHVQRASQSLLPFSPINILSRLPNIGGNLGCGKQEDAHEFMRFAIDKMQSACLDEFGGEKVLDPSTQETTLIQHIFGGHLQSQVKCSQCQVISNRYENMMDLTVEIQGDAESLEECLVQFTAGEWLDGENKYRCDGCNDYVKAWKRLTVHQAPNVLTIALKRFQSGRFGKLNKRITFPVNLDLTPYMSYSDGSDLYDLYAVVVHLDMLNSSFFGHYICYTKDYCGRWYRVDDHKVMQVELEEVLAQGAYMLLYRRKTARAGPLRLPNERIKNQQPSQVAISSTAKVSSPLDNSCQSLKNETEPESIVDSMDRDTRSERKLSATDVTKDSDIEDMDVDISSDVKSIPLPGDQGNTDMDNCSSELSVSKVPDEVSCVGQSSMQEDALALGQLNLFPTESPSVSSDLDSYMEVGNQPSSAEETSNTPKDLPCHSVASQNIVRSSNGALTNPSQPMETSANSRPELEQSVGAGSLLCNGNQMQSPISASHRGVGSKASLQSLDNGSVGKPKDVFSRGFLDRPPRRKSLDSEKRAQIGNGIALSTMTNGICNGHMDNGAAKQETFDVNINGVSRWANGSSMASVSVVSSVNGDDSASKGSFCQNGDILEDGVSFVSRGFLTKSSREALLKNKIRREAPNSPINYNGFAHEVRNCPMGVVDPGQETLSLNCSISAGTSNGKLYDIAALNINGAANHTEDEAVKVAASEDSRNSGKEDQLK